MRAILTILTCCLITAGPVFAGTSPFQPKMGDPIDGLTPTELQRFIDGKAAFTRVFTAADGLGPIFNKESCANCHNNPVGGAGSQTVTRFGIPDQKGGPFNPLTELGGSLLQQQAISPSCQETVPDLPGIFTTFRATPSALGFGLIEAIADADIEAGELAPPPGISGRVHWVSAVEDPPGSPLPAGRFGWKSQVATMMTFSAGASKNEVGITNPLNMQDNDPNGINPPALADCDSVADPEVGMTFIQQLTDFQRFLAPPPQTPQSGMTGEAVFSTIGCTDCHIPAFTTPDDPALEGALRNRVLKPYSDFLLHDMGLLFDGIPQGGAQAGEIRTLPLWGIRIHDPMLHDASVSGSSFATRVSQAIADHGQIGSEAKPAVDQFFALSQADRDAVIAFLDSLGRREFDHDGDNDVDANDQAQFIACYSGAVPAYTPDDACSISDVDQNGTVDCADWQVFEAAFLADNGVLPILGMTDFVNVLVGTDLTAAHICIADMNKDGTPDGGDIGDYITAVLAGS
ncbi:MAG: di-heme oxidoredictase family protein [Phycisphaerae bacterium]